MLQLTMIIEYEIWYYVLLTLWLLTTPIWVVPHR